jgi:hypothetical protein
LDGAALADDLERSEDADLLDVRRLHLSHCYTGAKPPSSTLVT